MNYQFYVKMDEQEFGPYSLNEIKELPLLDDTLVTESRLNGEWRPACEFDFQSLSEALNERKVSSTKQVSVQQLSIIATDSSQKSREVNGEQEPPILNLWNWGAFVLPWIWGVCNNIYWPLVIIALNFIPYAGPFLGLAISVYLGIYGNKLAWDKVTNNHSDHKRFTRIQGLWNTAGILIFLLLLLVVSCLIVIKFF